MEFLLVATEQVKLPLLNGKETVLTYTLGLGLLVQLKCIKHAETDCEDGEMRLVGGNDIAGAVAICRRGVWGVVCDHYWDSNDARVVCRHLGLPSECEQHNYHHIIYYLESVNFFMGVSLIPLQFQEQFQDF